MSRLLPEDRYGRLTFVRQVSVDSKGERFMRVRCDCGKTLTVRFSNLRRGITRSCGCLRHELLLARNDGQNNHAFRHGMIDHPLYDVWKNMKQRCLNKNHPEFKYWGGRGIGICKSWAKDSGRFIRWGVAHGWRRGLLLDRRENDDHYRPGNCRFVTPKQSTENRRICKK